MHQLHLMVHINSDSYSVVMCSVSPAKVAHCSFDERSVLNLCINLIRDSVKSV